MLKIYVASHVKVGAPSLPYLGFVQTGAETSDAWEGFAQDNGGTHISAKNPHYSELTALYWLWKNTQDAHVGLCHYRRYFCPIILPPENRVGATLSRDMAQQILALDEQGRIFETEATLADMVVPARDPRPRSAAKMYAEHCRASDWNAMLQALSDIYPYERQPAESFFDTAHPLHYYNMFITRRDVVDIYCSWLFPLLFHIETLIVPSEDPYQCRVFGFLAERLFNWWTASRAIRLVERPILQIV